jgi:UPF0176 protein
MPSPYSVTAFYKFQRLERDALSSICTFLREQGKELGICGLLLVAPEGINGTIAGSPEDIERIKQILSDKFGEIIFKDSVSVDKPFKRFKVDLREEIVSLGKPEIAPEGTETNYLTPEEWNRILEQEDVVLLDTRNTYETAIGTFKGAVDPGLSRFSEFPEYVKQCGIPKDKKVLMFCTGGIRCEKAALEMKSQGYEQVYQLDGGILRYLAESPARFFEGECFVFDHRVAVTQSLEPSARYKLCPHCGDPGDVRITCMRCDAHAVICQACSLYQERRTCSLNCQYHEKKAVQTHEYIAK